MMIPKQVIIRSYLSSPRKNSGTFFTMTKKVQKNNYSGKLIELYFSRKEKETWHSYEGDGLNDRIALVYNLMTKELEMFIRLRIKVIYLVI